MIGGLPRYTLVIPKRSMALPYMPPHWRGFGGQWGGSAMANPMCCVWDMPGSSCLEVMVQVRTHAVARTARHRSPRGSERHTGGAEKGGGVPNERSLFRPSDRECGTCELGVFKGLHRKSTAFNTVQWILKRGVLSACSLVAKVKAACGRMDCAKVPKRAVSTKNRTPTTAHITCFSHSRPTTGRGLAHS